MNKSRRQQIQALISQMEPLLNTLESIMDDEQYYYDNIPENLQGGLRAGESEDALDGLQSALDSLGEVVESLQTI